MCNCFQIVIWCLSVIKIWNHWGSAAHLWLVEDWNHSFRAIVNDVWSSAVLVSEVLRETGNNACEIIKFWCPRTFNSHWSEKFLIWLHDDYSDFVLNPWFCSGCCAAYPFPGESRWCSRQSSSLGRSHGTTFPSRAWSCFAGGALYLRQAPTPLQDTHIHIFTIEFPVW